MDPFTLNLIQILVSRVVIPEVIDLAHGDPNITPAQVLEKLSADAKLIISGNQTFLDSIRTAAGKA